MKHIFWTLFDRLYGIDDPAHRKLSGYSRPGVMAAICLALGGILVLVGVLV